MERPKRNSSKFVGFFGLACVLYAIYSLAIGEMHFPAKGGMTHVTGWHLVYRAFGLLLGGTYAATYIFHNGYNYTNKTIYKISKVILVATGLYGLVIITVVTIALINGPQ